jgi:hypothetical protein
MKGIVISYVYDLPGVDGKYVNDMPRAYRQHEVPNVRDEMAIEAQVRAERTDVSANSVLDWHGSQLAKPATAAPKALASMVY